MSILIDLSQIAIGNLMQTPEVRNKGVVEPDLVKHMVINSIRAYKQKFSREYGEIIICCDSKYYWRKDIFPYYKEGRKKTRDSSKVDWKDIYACVDLVKKDLREHFPYKVLEIEKAEADDIIAVLSKRATEKTVIVSGDKDYVQLHSDLVSQYSPRTKKMVTCDNPKEFLNELIISGDESDGIPNIKSDSDTFVNDSKRQKPMMKKDLGSWKKFDSADKFCETKLMLENHQRNKELIDFSYIPESIVAEILEAYKIEPKGNKDTIRKYFVKNRMSNLLEYLQYF